jgi:hypothetical protein
VGSSPPSKLDFALVRVAPANPPERPPREPLRPNPGRLAVEDEPVFVFQHPGGDRMKWSAGRISHLDRANGVLTHTADTDRGSSGAPLLTADLHLIGLHWGHHQGDNRGSLISSIVANLGGRFPT